MSVNPILGTLRNRTAGRLKTAEWRKMLRETVHSRSCATFLYVILPSWVFQPSCCVRSLLTGLCAIYKETKTLGDFVLIVIVLIKYCWKYDLYSIPRCHSFTFVWLKKSNFRSSWPFNRGIKHNELLGRQETGRGSLMEVRWPLNRERYFLTVYDIDRVIFNLVS